MSRASQRAMFANIQGHKVRFGSEIIINTGRKDRHVKLVEQHMGGPTKICVKYKGKKFLVPKKSVVL